MKKTVMAIPTVVVFVWVAVAFRLAQAGEQVLVAIADAGAGERVAMGKAEIEVEKEAPPFSAGPVLWPLLEALTHMPGARDILRRYWEELEAAEHDVRVVIAKYSRELMAAGRQGTDEARRGELLSRAQAELMPLMEKLVELRLHCAEELMRLAKEDQKALTAHLTESRLRFIMRSRSSQQMPDARPPLAPSAERPQSEPPTQGAAPNLRPGR